MPLPALRQFESFPAIVNGEKGFVIRDPLGFSNEFFIKEEVAFIIYFFNGVTPMRDLQDNFYFRFRRELPTNFVKEIISFFDQNYLLDNVRFRKKLNDEKEKFKKEKVRKLNDTFFLEDEKGKEFFKDFIKEVKSYKNKKQPEQGIISPHIDYFRGKESYVKVYSGLINKNFKRFIILGTNHTMFKDEFIVAEKDFETPTGKLVQYDREFIENLKNRFGEKYFEDSIAHKYEHSIEFQVNILAELFEDFTILPILAPSFLDGRKHSEFIDWLKELLNDDIFLIAASDLSHRGIQFGDPFPAIEKREETVNYDKEVLDLAIEKKPDDFINKLIENKNFTNICGMGPIYTLLKLVKKEKGELIDYRFTIDESGGSMVSFAGIYF